MEDNHDNRFALEDLPVLGICGHGASGKTTLIERALPALRAKGLRVAVVKHTPHLSDPDIPGKDSDRIFRSGADVLLRGSDEGFFRTHAADAPDLPSLLLHLVERYDLVLVEGYKRAAIEKVWVLKEGETSAPADVPQVIATLPPGDGRPAQFASLLDDWLREQWLKTPVYGAVLIGGGSRRMGKPKHLMLLDGKTWGERTVDLLREISQEVVILGDGDVPGSLGECVRLPDAPDAEGPMAGILTAMRWAPLSSWLVSACDLPHLSTDALRWILSARSPGVWATLPKRKGADVIEPLLGHYDFRARSLLERLTRASRYRLNELAGEEKVSSPTPPEHLEQAWFNANTPDDLKR